MVPALSDDDFDWVAVAIRPLYSRLITNRLPTIKR